MGNTLADLNEWKTFKNNNLFDEDLAKQPRDANGAVIMPLQKECCIGNLFVNGFGEFYRFPDVNISPDFPDVHHGDLVRSEFSCAENYDKDLL